MRLVFGQDRAVAEWVMRRIPHMTDAGLFTAIGISDGAKPIAGVIYNEHVPAYGTIQMSAAADDPRWAQRGILYALFSYPFDQLDCRKVWAVVPHRNTRAIRFNKGIGFTQEGGLRHQFGRDHAMFFGMMKSEFEKRYRNGQKLTVAASAA